LNKRRSTFGSLRAGGRVPLRPPRRYLGQLLVTTAMLVCEQKPPLGPPKDPGRPSLASRSARCRGGPRVIREDFGDALVCMARELSGDTLVLQDEARVFTRCLRPGERARGVPCLASHRGVCSRSEASVRACVSHDIEGSAPLAVCEPDLHAVRCAVKKLMPWQAVLWCVIPSCDSFHDMV
jgi:hypothetical protein